MNACHSPGVNWRTGPPGYLLLRSPTPPSGRLATSTQLPLEKLRELLTQSRPEPSPAGELPNVGISTSYLTDSRTHLGGTILLCVMTKPLKVTRRPRITRIRDTIRPLLPHRWDSSERPSSSSANTGQTCGGCAQQTWADMVTPGRSARHSSGRRSQSPQRPRHKGNKAAGTPNVTIRAGGPAS
jgi:hypothetical protein